VAEPLPQIVFATAYDQYAVRAFDVNAVDYLLKPLTAHAWSRPWSVCEAVWPKHERLAARVSNRVSVALAETPAGRLAHPSAAKLIVQAQNGYC